MNDFEELLFTLQKKIQLAAHKIESLTTDNRALQDQLTAMQSEKEALNRELHENTEQLRALEEKHATSLSVDVGERFAYLSTDEREALERQIDALIARIDSHLG